MTHQTHHETPASIQARPAHAQREAQPVLHEVVEPKSMCPVCDGTGFCLGAMGRLNWNRCHSCGMVYCDPYGY
jgi:hypothetical protein